VAYSLDPIFDGTYSLMQRSFAGNPAWRNENGKAYIYTNTRPDGSLHWVFDNDLDGKNGIFGGTLAQETDKYPCIRGRGPEMWGGHVGLSKDTKTFHWNPQMKVTPFGLVKPSCPALQLRSMGHKCDTLNLCESGLECIVLTETENTQGEYDSAQGVSDEYGKQQGGLYSRRHLEASTKQKTSGLRPPPYRGVRPPPYHAVGHVIHSVQRTVYVTPAPTPTPVLGAGMCIKIIQQGEECKLNWVFLQKNNPRAWTSCAEGLRCTPKSGEESNKPDKGICKCTKDGY